MSDKTIVVGVHPGQPVDVVRTAAALARDLCAVLTCAFVDVTQFDTDGELRPIDPDVESDGDGRSLRERLDGVLADYEISWDFQVLGGSPAEALARLSADLGAYAIVVGTRHQGARAAVEEFFGGSVAVHLAHHQHLPVVVVPLSPTPPGQAAPWER